MKRILTVALVASLAFGSAAYAVDNGNMSQDPAATATDNAMAKSDSSTTKKHHAHKKSAKHAHKKHMKKTTSDTTTSTDSMSK